MAEAATRTDALGHARAEDSIRSGEPRVSVIVRAFNEAAYIGTLLKRIENQTYRNIETILVDSGSTDSTVGVASAFVDRIVHIPSETFSFGRALNLGCEAASGGIFVFASAHVFPDASDWIERLIEPIVDGGYALVYGRQRGDHRSQFSEHQIFHSWFPDHDINDQESPFCNNANAAIDGSWWESCKYDEGLTGLEDIAWAKEIQSRGGRIAYRASAGVVHVHEETYERIFNRYRREAIALRHIYPGAHVSVAEAFRLFFAGCWLDVRVAIRQGHRLSSVLAQIVRFRFNQYWGTYRGHNDRGALSDDLRRVLYYPPRTLQTSEHGATRPLQSAGSDR